MFRFTPGPSLLLASSRIVALLGPLCALPAVLKPLLTLPAVLLLIIFSTHPA